MSGISIKINLEALKCVKQKKKGKSGEVMCLVIPIGPNHLFEGEKGTYLDLQAFELKNPRADSKDTHLVKQSLPKEVFNAMSDEEKKAIPILGNAIVWGGGTGEVATAQIIDEDDDLPF